MVAVTQRPLPSSPSTTWRCSTSPGPTRCSTWPASSARAARSRCSRSGSTGDPAVGRGGFTVLPTYSLDDAPLPDLVVIPGGAGTRPLMKDERLLAWVRERAAEVELLLSVCTGALVLGAAGLLERRPATTHHDAYDELAAMSPTTQRGARAAVRAQQRDDPDLGRRVGRRRPRAARRPAARRAGDPGPDRRRDGVDVAVVSAAGRRSARRA